MARDLTEEELLQLVKRLNLNPISETDSPTAAVLPNNSMQHGSAQIQDNHFLASDPQNGGIQAVIQPVHPVIILKNGKEHTDAVTVASSDKLEWKINETPLYSIEVTADNMEVYFQLFSKERYGWNLADTEPGANIRAEAIEDRCVVLQAISLPEVMNRAQQMLIKKNLNVSAIFQELQSPTHEKIIIAQGLPAQESVDARLELYFSEDVKSILQEADEKEKVDFRNHLHIPSVQKGDIIAKKIPMSAGAAGYDVYGESIQPSPPKDIMIVAKENTAITPDGEVVALIQGRPRITGKAIKYFDITTSYIVSSDVDIKTGNIVFTGDVVVYGNVMEGMIIEALGNVYIAGNVYQSTITATGSITVLGNVLKGNLYSGHFGVLFNRLYIACKSLAQSLQQLVEASKSLYGIVERNGHKIKIGQVIMMLIENKFQNITRDVQEALSCIRSLQMIKPHEMEDIKKRISMFLSPHLILALDSLNEIMAVLHIVQETKQNIESLQENKANVEIRQCNAAVLKATGDIIIRKEGSLQTLMQCKGNIVFLGHQAVCRGGRLEAGGSIAVMNVGGESGGGTFLRAGKKITAEKIHHGKISIGKYMREVVTPISDVTAYVRNNTLVIETQSESIGQ